MPAGGTCSPTPAPSTAGPPRRQRNREAHLPATAATPVTAGNQAAVALPGGSWIDLGLAAAITAVAALPERDKPGASEPPPAAHEPKASAQLHPDDYDTPAAAPSTDSGTAADHDGQGKRPRGSGHPIC